RTSCGASCMQRILRTCAELPPRQARGAASSSSTLAPASRAIRAAHRAALPPPITRTSTTGSMGSALAGAAPLLVHLQQGDDVLAAQALGHGQGVELAGERRDRRRHADGATEIDPQGEILLAELHLEARLEILLDRPREALEELRG